jgi:hypothetical protein
LHYLHPIMTDSTITSRVGRRIARYGAPRLARRLGIAAPVVGTVVALAIMRSAVKRKGVLGGTVDTALNAVPFVGAIKNAIEVFRGDFIRDRATEPPEGRRSVHPPDPAAPRGRAAVSRLKSIKL